MGLPDLKACFSQLIKANSISAITETGDHSNLEVIELLQSWLTDLGFHCQTQAVKDSRGKYNLLATLLPSNGVTQGGLLLAGHSDTVPIDEGHWHQDPFQLTERDNRWYGLGSCDMKGFFAICIAALQELPLKQLTKPLYIFASADEETTMNGAKAFVEQFANQRHFTPEFAIIGEPTGMAPVYMHKGHLAKGIRITGRSGHSSDPSKGLNAIEIMHDVITQLTKLKQALINQYQQTSFSVPYPTLNLGHIHGGDAANRICGCCELHIDLRPIPGIPLEELEILIRQYLSPIQQNYPGAVDIFNLYPGNEAFGGKLDAPWTQTAARLCQQAPQVVNYATEAPYISLLGCQTLVLGPGSIEQAHQPNEFIDTSVLPQAQSVFKELIYNCCLN
ncbi:acetylornithine deacetylase [Shewanella sp. NIFS-20-20]|uniref:acetylornithine deacetylase n=1 Tax=Shewanella sp. NIFS-20-20 TaxID=2853806 RepID=UPI001C47AD6D|nr:acetylornithine deacetylase [Shewanella sp. NIFS-20-20]MBV7315380.1 acetylornithine deacetylase [Shewanella sp. NIFS-20-20]